MISFLILHIHFQALLCILYFIFLKGIPKLYKLQAPQSLDPPRLVHSQHSEISFHILFGISSPLSLRFSLSFLCWSSCLLDSMSSYLLHSWIHPRFDGPYIPVVSKERLHEKFIFGTLQLWNYLYFILQVDW